MAHKMTEREWVEYYLEHPDELASFVRVANDVANEQQAKLDKLLSLQSEIASELREAMQDGVNSNMLRDWANRLDRGKND